LYAFENASGGGEVLVVVEGPVDAAKINYYGNRYGVFAVAASTSEPNKHQVDQINLLVKLYDSCIIMLDRGELLKASAILGSFLCVARTSEPPYGAKDFGELTPKQSVSACRQLAQGSVFR
jgi:hypothetical protein